MDLNQLLYHHQVAVIRSGEAVAPRLGSHFDIVSHYERRISRMREMLGVPQYPGWLDATPAAAS